MPSNDGLPGSPRSFSMASLRESLRQMHEAREAGRLLPAALTREEEDAIADGEPYCFRCGKPASSFPEYRIWDDLTKEDPVAYVLREEGTYNRETNRFACDACYIAIGMPAGPNGWEAP